MQRIDKIEKDRRKALKRKFKVKEREQTLVSLPITLEKLKELFGWLDEQLKNNNCDYTFKNTQIFIEQNNLPEGKLLEWLQNQGGYCDCEILMNVSEKIEN